MYSGRLESKKGAACTDTPKKRTCRGNQGGKLYVLLMTKYRIKYTVVSYYLRINKPNTYYKMALKDTVLDFKWH